MSKEDIDFQIGFYERLIGENPDFSEALIALGDAYTKKGLYGKGLAVDKKLAALRPDDPAVHYNLACDYSLLKMQDESLRELEVALRTGYRDFGFMEKDPDLQFIRQENRYAVLVEKYREKKAKK